MRMLKTVAVVAAFVFAVVSLAEEHNRTEIRIAVDDGAGDPHAVYSWSGADMGFDLHEMQEGESRSFVDEAGRSILVTREADGMKFDVDGKTIRMPLFDGEHGPHGLARARAGNFDVMIAGDESGMTMDGVTIISGKPLDASTQESIKSVLLSAGHDGQVRFVDHSTSFSGALVNPHGDHHIKVIRNEVDVTR